MTPAGDRLDELIRIMATLRSPQGCPWDREQTLRSLRPFLLEETYEALEAIDRDDPRGLCEELGDVLFEVVFLSCIAEEQGHFTMADVAAGVAAKLVRRHPHVFGDAEKLGSADAVLVKWEELKAAEKPGGTTPKTLLSGVPISLPALLRAYEYAARAATVGFDWVRAEDVLDKIDEEAREVRAAVEARRHPSAGSRSPEALEGHDVTTAPRHEDHVAEEIGDLLFAVANLARKLGVEPEAALRNANDKFRGRFEEMERRVTARGEKLRDKSLDELETEWQSVKNG
jgi:tetrapyrrole methylase family protein/MazG family protein